MTTRLATSSISSTARWACRVFGLLMWTGAGGGSVAFADAPQIYQSQQTFLAQAFDGSPPAPRVVWLTGALRDTLKQALQHEPRVLRVRYWARGPRTAWVLEEIGKTQPITAGVVIENHKIVALSVLVFRESRGWEIKHDFFTRQFTQLGLTKNRQLDKHIDGITGATLSVNAMRRVALAALILDHAVADKRPSIE